ncbi:hypothetical protein FOQG_03800 [Fusarium oxysporum f. sp. raphani 54005]|uniref:Uncharacterized protein n=7 Tax=Fusarium oxysporum TaxID=5507 RepID=X0DL58_FUSOX|nr:hypothetical protein FOXG_20032 [Fusarium oxysporum f. sp. lycopersici 4287]EWZ34783.1 hypothetical protein FOZG_12639 [Fusarium oxysporum Fo47]EWZ95122.1 hypothetical protein FOWG_05147 [Fusarium oxysporum f. sp. lycopersici MN25]EXA38730.1 hypothetical protein FOVG_10562 [Fusarium oxysporum f. sp. pisi HDV247]EXK37429.1 hypothetical protein FOMG_08172 [Fusarium oxysporum f. sp. melonis 26406]EXK95112.1 hypothetical protein FOQG_03800 [Fusarium oxysporum f. sp. raphani 54005]EXL48498.1 hy
MDTDKPGKPGGFGPLVTIQSETLYERQPLT